MPNSFYDDPRWSASSDDRIRFTTIGDSVRGRVTGLKFVAMMNDQVPIATLADVVARQDGQEVRRESADVNLNLTHLQRVWNTEKPDIGDVVTITYTENRNVGQPQPMKIFGFDVQRRPARATTPADSAQPPLSDDVFG